MKNLTGWLSPRLANRMVTLLLSLVLPLGALAQEQGDWLFRMGIMNFEPSVDSSPVETPTSGLLSGSGIGIDGDAQFGLNLTYMLTNSLALEGTLSAPFEHELAISGLDRYGLTTTALGESKQISPTLSALYYFGAPSDRFRPYLGAGLSYTHFFDDSLSTQARSELGASGLEFDEHIGMSVRAGFDWRLGNGWFLNTSVWRMNIDTNASFNSEFGPISTYVEMDPWVYSLTLGHEFSW
ncbi:MAG: outer membrane beta-barrel protein [Pseudomonadales bacterium]|nr:outer membrane beta-barrel protein [Pseudomonadales bacterium]